ncbi:MAG: hypothetical protein COV47_01795 [Candidatus Diapherotrites archaeon CG11_big_fil_rev_8_21_14_0_20_37_9]|nr:MAG: hypothetical protein COV47_01795 [Candidatus Diapherotrites archaeon CG11_big_fil_rev_8_21_14_0_20_37_9]
MVEPVLPGVKRVSVPLSKPKIGEKSGTKIKLGFGKRTVDLRQQQPNYSSRVVPGKSTAERVSPKK